MIGKYNKRFIRKNTTKENIMSAKKVREIFCHECHKYTSHYLSDKVNPPHALGAAYRCRKCETIPTIYNVGFAYQKENDQLDILMDDLKSSECLLVPSPLFDIGNICLVRDSDGIVYAHCKILGVRHKIDHLTLSNWEYYVAIYGKSEPEWIKEYNIRGLNKLTGGTEVNERSIEI